MCAQQTHHMKVQWYTVHSSLTTTMGMQQPMKHKCTFNTDLGTCCLFCECMFVCVCVCAYVCVRLFMHGHGVGWGVGGYEGFFLKTCLDMGVLEV